MEGWRGIGKFEAGRLGLKPPLTAGVTSRLKPRPTTIPCLHRRLMPRPHDLVSAQRTDAEQQTHLIVADFETPGLAVAEALVLRHGAFHLFARRVRCGANSLDTQLEIVGIRCA